MKVLNKLYCSTTEPAGILIPTCEWIFIAYTECEHILVQSIGNLSEGKECPFAVRYRGDITQLHPHIKDLCTCPGCGELITLDVKRSMILHGSCDKCAPPRDWEPDSKINIKGIIE
jgi:hypothetical protein